MRAYPLLFLAVVACQRTRADPSSPHVVLISVDTLRRDHLGIYGHPRDTSPHIDAFARESIVFEDAIAVHTNTAPSHASMLTGLHPPGHGILRNEFRLKAGVRTLGQILTDQGYLTAAFTSGFTLRHANTGLGRGFSEYEDAPKNRDRPAAMTAASAEAWLSEHAASDAPMFLFFHLFDPHFPYRSPKLYASRFIPDGRTTYRYPVGADLNRIRTKGPEPWELAEYIGRYDGEIAYADAHVGRLLDWLDKQGFYDNAMILFISDHGETLDDRPFQLDHGARVVEEQIRIPLVVRLPRGERGGTRLKGGAHHTDVLPTVLAVLGIPGVHTHGRSLLPAMRGEAALPLDRPLFSFARPVPQRVSGLREPMVKRGLVSSARLYPLKLVAYPTQSGTTHQLFNLADDPGEKNDIAPAQPGLVAKLDSQLKRWLGSMEGDISAPVPALAPDVETALRALGYVQ